MTARFALVTLCLTLVGLNPAALAAQELGHQAVGEPSNLLTNIDGPKPVLPRGFEQVGDMILELSAGPRAATGYVAFGSKPWPGGTLPIVFDASVTAQQQQYFLNLCNGVWGSLANVRCVGRTTQASWVAVSTQDNGCYSYLGAPQSGAGARPLNLQNGGCWTQDTVLHELGHAFGFMHEHQRPDRDQFIEIRTQNIIAGYANQLAIVGQGTGDVYTRSYDFGSIMHYWATAFSSNGQPTIVPKPQYAAIAGNFGHATLPSALDADALRYIYGAAATLTAPGAPTALNAQVTGTQVAFSWGAPTTGGAPASYVISAQTPIGARVGTWDVGNVLRQNMTFTAGVYVVTVQAKNAAGLGPAATLQLTISNTPAVPGAPANLTATVQGQTMTLRWNPPVSAGPVQSYELVYGFQPGVTNGAVGLGNTTSVSFGGVPFGTFYLRVRARNAVGVSSESNEVRVVIGVSAPEAPSLLPVEGRGTNSFRLVWIPGAGAAATHYLLEASTTPGGPANIGTFPLTGTSLDVAGVPAGAYYLRLRAVNASGVSAPSQERLLLAR